MASPKPGWYPDPANDLQSRYFDGSAWTDKYKPVAPPEPPSDAPPAFPPTESVEYFPPPPGYAPLSSTNHFSNISITLGLLAFLFVPPILGGIGIAMGIKAQRLGEPRSRVAIAISATGIVLGMILGVYLAEHVHSNY